MTENQVYYRQGEARMSIWAVISLISGVANFIGVPFFGALAALITGYVAKSEIEKSAGRVEGDRIAKVGIILGWIGIALSILGFCFAILVTLGVLGGSIALCGPFSDWIQTIPLQ